MAIYSTTTDDDDDNDCEFFAKLQLPWARKRRLNILREFYIFMIAIHLNNSRWARAVSKQVENGSEKTGEW